MYSNSFIELDYEKLHVTSKKCSSAYFQNFMTFLKKAPLPEAEPLFLAFLLAKPLDVSSTVEQTSFTLSPNFHFILAKN